MEMDAIALERRLTLIESAQTHAALLAASNHTTVISAVSKVDVKIEQQSNRINKLENWRTQVTAIYGGILVAAPFVFYGLTRLFGG